jgi:large subunit ribosomal protein L30e
MATAAMGTQETRKEIQQLTAARRLIVGAQRTVKLLKQGKVEKVFVSSNCRASTAKSLAHYCSILKIACEELPINSSQLGVVCKKPFSISVLSVKKE